MERAQEKGKGMSAVKSWSRLWSGIYLGRGGARRRATADSGRKRKASSMPRGGQKVPTTACGSPESTGCHVVLACGGSSRDRTALVATHTCLGARRVLCQSSSRRRPTARSGSPIDLCPYITHMYEKLSVRAIQQRLRAGHFGHSAWRCHS